MNVQIISANNPIKRIYIAAATLNEFRGHKNVEVQLFRTGGDQEEAGELLKLDLVGPPSPEMPAELLGGATREAAIACLQEAFTQEEIDDLVRYLKERYDGQFSNLTICPVNLPIPLGVGPLALIPESETSGFINFDLAPGYELPFTFKGYYDLAETAS